MLKGIVSQYTSHGTNSVAKENKKLPEKAVTVLADCVA